MERLAICSVEYDITIDLTHDNENHSISLIRPFPCSDLDRAYRANSALWWIRQDFFYSSTDRLAVKTWQLPSRFGDASFRSRTPKIMQSDLTLPSLSGPPHQEQAANE